MTEPLATPALPPQLDYGLAAPKRAKRIRRFILLLLAVGLGYACWEWGPAVAKKATILFWQRQCMRYTAPADQVVYEEDPVEAARLLKNQQGYFAYRLNRGLAADPTPVKSVAAASFPRCWKRLLELDPPAATSALLPGMRSGAIVFLHERTSSAGNRRLVCVRYFAETYSFTLQLIENYNSQMTVRTPADWTKPAVSGGARISPDVPPVFPRHPPRLHIFAGQIDPDDPSRFTIHFQAWGKPGVIGGQLLDDDTIRFTMQNPPQDD